MQRRAYLERIGAAGGIGLAAGLAGCSGGGSEPTTDSETTTATPETETTASEPGTTTTADPATTTEAEPTTPTTETVTMARLAFDPVRVTVDVGTTVEWVNEGSTFHTIVASDLTGNSADWSFDERTAVGESTSYTFENAGVYEYFCDVHGQQNMCGVVLVGDATLDASLPCE